MVKLNDLIDVEIIVCQYRLLNSFSFRFGLWYLFLNILFPEIALCLNFTFATLSEQTLFFAPYVLIDEVYKIVVYFFFTGIAIQYHITGFFLFRCRVEVQ